MGLLDGLNAMQKQAAETTEGPLLILAGAGSGKTRTIISRIAYILEQKKAWPSQILAITFTNKAAGEMRERIAAMDIPDTERIWMSTFHAMCAKIMRMYAEKLGYSKRFTIYDTQDQKRLYKSLVKSLNLDEKLYSFNTLSAIVSEAKNAGQSPAAFKATHTGGDIRSLKAGLYYEAYQKALADSDAMDFDDLIYNTNVLFKNHADVLAHFQDRFKYILVDEYQDTNHSQYELVNMLAAKHRNLCVCGDDDQSIYGWRGADISNILDFEDDWPDAKTVKLEENYRSTPVILECANQVIAHNTGRKSKNLWTANETGEGFDKVTLAEFDEGMGEAKWISDTIRSLRADKGYSYNDFAILYRTNAQSRLFEEAFMRAQLPYKVVGGTGFYSRMEIRDMTAYLNVINNLKDNMGLLRIINTPKRGIGAATITKISQYADFKGWGLAETILNWESIPTISGSAKNKVGDFAGMLARLRKAAETLPVDALIREVYTQSGYENMLLLEKVESSQNRMENIEELIAAAAQFAETSDDTSLTAFLETAALASETDHLDDEDGQILLMTLHNAKGLEFPVVFMPGMEEGIFPGRRSYDSPEALEEERRICYVGITRAREKLYLTHANSRMLYGRTEAQAPSQFLKELPASNLERVEMAVPRHIKKEASRPTHNMGQNISSRSSMFASATVSSVSGSSFQAGEKVSHKSFGTGTIVEAKEHLITVAFPGIGIKKLDPGFVTKA